MTPLPLDQLEELPKAPAEKERRFQKGVIIQEQDAPATVLQCSAAPDRSQMSREEQKDVDDSMGTSDAANADMQSSNKENRPEAHSIKSAANWMHMREVEDLKQQLAHETKLREKAEAQAGLGRHARMSAMISEEQLQMQAQGNEALKKKCLELEARCNATTKSATAQLRNAADLSAKMLKDKEQAMQKDVESAQAQVRDCERRLCEQKKLELEIETLRKGNKALTTQLQAESVSTKQQTEHSATQTTHDDRRVEEDVERYRQEFESEMKAEIARNFASLLSELGDLRDRTSRNEELVLDWHSEQACCIPEQAGYVDAMHVQHICETQLIACRVVHQSVVRGLIQQMSPSRCGADDDGAGEPSQSQSGGMLEQLSVQSELSFLHAEVDRLQDSLQRSREELQQQRLTASEASRLHEESVASQSEELKTLRWRLAQSPTLCAEKQAPTEEHRCSDAQDQSLQNRELLFTVQQFKQDCEMLEAENASLRDTVATFEESLERVTGQHAKLIGHVNHKQKIKYTIKLKEENAHLRDELKKSRKLQLSSEANKHGGLLEALPSLATLSQTCAAQRQRSPGVRPVDAWIAQGLSQTQQSLIEAISLDFLHLRALIERAVSPTESSASRNCDMGTLLQRLRRVVADGRRTRSGSAVTITTKGAASGVAVQSNGTIPLTRSGDLQEIT